MKSLKLKIMLFITIATIAAMGAVSYLNYSQASGILTAELEKAATNSAEYNARIINEWLRGITKDINNRASGATVKSMDPEQFLPVLKRVQQNIGEYEYLYVADNTGNGIGTNDVPVDVSDRDYFQQVLQGETVVTDPIISKATGNQVIAVVAPIHKDDDGTPDGLVGVTVMINQLQELVNNMKLSGYGYGFIQSTNSITIAHPNDEFSANNNLLEAADDDLKTILGRMAKGENGYGTYTLEGEYKLLAFAPVGLAGWSVAQTANVSDVMSPLGILRTTGIWVALAAMLVMLGIALLIANAVSKPVTALSKIAEAVAEGDLTQKVTVTGSDEIGALAASFIKMSQNLKSMIAEIGKNAAELASHSQELAASSEEVSATVEEVASTTNQVAATSAQGVDNAIEAARESEQVQLVAQEGNNAVHQTVEKINSISEASKNVATAIQKLGEQSNKIGEIINTITSIADQTNLLALNAAIEAARAGEQGRGFAVVAEEVRKLAEQSSGAAGEITGLIKEIQVGVGVAVTAMERGAAEVNEGVKVAENAGISINRIIKAVGRSTELIQDVAEGSKQANEGTQQLTAANEQIASTVQQVTQAAQDLAGIAVELQKSVVKFKV
ncbi:MAG TPA: methyl-accepting chemotaxis protein [Desulfotomaculum sp.]|nr:MAG: hypothetical protein VR67_10530 [Peptococcaceae bacterium BRH_c8a]KJS77211.1 MAG: hypothetical protein JL56_03780 [Desulfotomaculum sp. BICA1-6]HBX22914.1 methyl-accepting chemotaxis protein [Desulfotomaculum sp.]